LACAGLEFNSANGSGEAIFFISLALAVLVGGIFLNHCADYNERNPAAPIRLWAQRCFLSGFVLCLAGFNAAVGTNQSIYLLFALGGFLALSAGQLFFYDRLRVTPESRDKEP